MIKISPPPHLRALIVATLPTARALAAAAACAAVALSPTVSGRIATVAWCSATMCAMSAAATPLRRRQRQSARDEAESRHAAKLALVASRTDNAVIITDVQGRIEWVNEGFTRISGYTPGEVRGRKPGSVLQGPATDPATVAYVRSQLAKGDGFKVEILNYAKNGRPYWLAVEVQPVRDNEGRLTQFMAIESDISDRKRVEFELKQAKESADRARAEAEEARASAESAKAAAESANRAKSEFLANMSHEIRTPLNGVIGMTDLLLGTELAPAQRKFAATAKNSAGTLLAVINQILDFSKIEAGKLELESIDFSPRTVVEEVAEMLTHKAEAKNLVLAHHVADDVPAVLRGDPDRLRQILINLVNNAIKFTERGEVSVRVVLGQTELTARPTSAGGQLTKLRFSVKDSGVGIPPDRLGRLFKSFSQVDASTTRKYGGTGLGLAICKQLVELMGGEIGVTSDTGGGDGHGSTFWFDTTFGPAALPAAPPTITPANVGADTRALGPNALTAPADRLILLAEDNEINQMVAVEILAKVGYRCDVVADGARAVRAVAEKRYDLVLMDCQMPEMDGFEATGAIRRWEAQRPATAFEPRRLPIIALTANAIKGDRERCLAAGMDDYLSKPLEAKQLVERIEAALARLGRREESLPQTSADPVAEAAPDASEPPADPIAMVDDRPFDVGALLDRCMGDPRFLKMLLAKFDAKAEATLRRLDEAVATSDAPQVAMVAHGFKGAVANLSAAAATKMASRLEELGNAGTLDGAARQLQELRAEVQRCVAYIPTAVSEAAKAPVSQ